MSTFIVVAALMAAIAAAVVAIPLLRSKRSRLLGVVTAALVTGTAACLYPLWSNWDWHAPLQAKAPPGPDVLAMISKLEKHLRDEPGDLTGWLMMGRSYMTLERVDDAVTAYSQAYALAKGGDAAKFADAALGLGEAMSVRAGGNITPQAAQFIEEAVKAAPDNPKALFYGGFAAALTGDVPLARERWQALKALHPPKAIEDMLDARLAELGTAAAGTNASPGGTNASGAPSAGPQVDVNIRIASALKPRVAAGAALFVFAKEPDGSGPPLAAKRLTTEAIGTRVSLSAADSMIPGRSFKSGQKISITARVSFSGQPTPAAGDLYGEAEVVAGGAGALNLTIDKVAGTQ